MCLNWNDFVLVGIVTASAAASEAESNAALLSRFSPNAEEHASSPLASSAVPQSASRTSNTSSHLPQLPASVNESSDNSHSLSAVATSVSTDVINYRYLPATHASLTTRAAGPAGALDLLSDDLLLPGLPPPLIPIPDRYQPLVDVQVSNSAETRVASCQLPDNAARKSVAVQQVRSSKTGECSVCMECEPDAALYPCGHMCMCYDCAVCVQKLRGALCPICRQPIIDILRIYRT